MEQTQNTNMAQGSLAPMSDAELEMRQKYLKQENETKEQREQRQKNVREMLAESRDKTVGVHNASVLHSFEKGRGV